jgi:limonene-1,2-epoxide hydrolase
LERQNCRWALDQPLPSEQYAFPGGWEDAVATEPEEVVRAMLAEFEGRQIDSGAIDRMLEHISPDAKWHVFAWEPPLVGRDAIRAELDRQAGIMTDVGVEIVSIACAGRRVFMERLDSLTVKATPTTLHVAAVFEVGDDGKIALWREYWDSKEIDAKLGAGTSSAGSRG